MVRFLGHIGAFSKTGARRAGAFAAAGLLALSMVVPMSQAAVAWADNAEAVQTDTEQSIEGAEYSEGLSQLNEYYLTNDGFVTPVRLQNPWGSCWAFAITSALESSILKAERKLSSKVAPGLALAGSTDYAEPQLTGLNESIDISERAIAWFAHQLQTEASGGAQAGEGCQRTDANDYTTQMAGGSFTTVESMLTSGQAIVAETSAPYQYNGYAAGDLPWYSLSANPDYDARTRDWSLPDSLRTQNDVEWVVTDTLRLSSPAISQFMNHSSTYTYQGYDENATTRIKETLVDVGAVAIALEADASLPQEVIDGRADQAQPSKHLTFPTWAQYNAATDFTTNHAVTIVGWDDSYSASNFAGTESGQPPADGAWLCKNDWGSDALFESLGDAGSAIGWGIQEHGSATGFFWVSYYDHTISEPTAFVVQPANQSYDVLYQHDYLAISEFLVPMSFEQDLWIANVFTAEDTELVKAVSAQTFSENDAVKIQVYMISDEYNDPGAEIDFVNIEDAEDDPDINVDVEILENARLVYEAEETFPTAGFHTIDLTNPVLVGKGQRFVVMQSISIGGNPDYHYLNLEAAFTRDSAAGGLETYGSVIANPGETYVNLSGDGWVSLDDFNIWYADYCAENGEPVSLVFGNALIKAYANTTSMSENGTQTYELVRL